MFCNHCQETAENTACTDVGICGKTEDVSVLHDMLTHALKGLGYFSVKAKELGIEDEVSGLFTAQALFSLVTNVNFVSESFVEQIKEAIGHRNKIRDLFLAAYKEKYGTDFSETLPDAASWQYTDGSQAEFIAKGTVVSIIANPQLDRDISSLRELLVYGLKGLAAYTEHGYMLDESNPELLGFLHEALAFTISGNMSLDDHIAMVMRCGEFGVKAMAFLDSANTKRFGIPEPTQVSLGVRNNPAILISGHDLRDLEDLLEQTKGTGVDVYTHSEMLPAHAYPLFKKYDNLVGNYGGAWWEQRQQFGSFNGAIIVTTNCIQDPKRTYRERIFTTGMVGWEGVPHIADRKFGGRKDFSAVIEKAKTCQPPKVIEEGEITVGFAHDAILSVADKVIDAVKAGDISRFVVMAGCDGHQHERRYYSKFAEALPKDSVILTAGCAKYRYNKLNLGDIGGIPRVLDAGQCNDSYSLVVVAMKLAEAFGVEHVNDLPISYNIAWYEQKAVIVLLSLLSLNVKKIRLGPTLPAFLSPNVVDVLVKNFELSPIIDVDIDLEAMMVGA